MPKVWYYSFESDISRTIEIISRLSGSGIDIGERGPNEPGEMGILFFDKFSDSLCDCLRELSGNGIYRVLAMTFSHSLHDNGKIWQLMSLGASDVLVADRSEDAANKIVARFKRWSAVEQLVDSPLVKGSLVGESRIWRSVLRQIVEIAHFTDSSVLITGDSGTGKELVARLIHTLDRRSDKRDLVVLDCTTVVSELSGSEFFGHERGAFTGAYAARDGAFALAHCGTLFLDEVSELPLKLQAQLLRVMQERTFKRVGGNTWHTTDFRLVCATNRDLMQCVKRGEFRSDLYYRIASWTCKLPPLCERNEDILLLANHFIKDLVPDGKAPSIDRPVRECLLKREYPGNVRDLKQLVSRIMHCYVGQGLITVGDIPEEERPSGEPGPMNWFDENLERAIRQALLFDVRLKEIRRVTDNTAIRIALSEENGNLQRTARRLGVTDRALQMRRAADRQKKDTGNGSEKNTFSISAGENSPPE